MNRALPLLVAIALLGGGLAFLALKTGPAGPAEEESQAAWTTLEPDASEAGPAVAAAASETDTSAALATVDANARAKAALRGGSARFWEIIPMNTVGQRVDDAEITATPSEELQGVAQTMKGSGRTRWTSLPAGFWTLTVESGEGPTWTREILLEADAPERTTVYLGEELRISGRIQDSNGAALPAKTPVFFLPKGVRHPTRAEMKMRATSRKKAGPTNGAIAVQTDRSGRFKTRVPKAGEYRLSVGAPDKPRWTQKKGVELTHGGADHVIVTVPALAELTVTFSGDPASRPTALSAYVFDAERAQRMAEQAAERIAPDAAQTLEEAQRQAKEAALGGKKKRGGGAKAGAKNGDAGGRSGTARTMREENARMQGADFEALDNFGGREVARSPLFEPGWRSLGSRQVTPQGEAVFNDLPDGEDLRFLFVRGPERIATAVAIRLRAQQRALGTVTLPIPATEPGFRQSNQATINVKDRPVTAEETTLDTGVAWTVASR